MTKPGKVLLLVVFALAQLLSVKASPAQPVIPAGDGTGTIVTPDGNHFNITGGALSGDGKNLFHSFQEFGLSQPQVANFISPSGNLDNILGRVVGGNPSLINGLLQVTGSHANLYLLNPAGVIFGPNASLNVPASFTATTANGIGFGNWQVGGEQWFNAIGPSNYATLMGSPTGYRFDLAQPASLINAGNLAVASGQNLNLLGGQVVSAGSLTAPDGQITIATVPGSSLVRLHQPGSLLSLEILPSTLPLAGGNQAPLNALSLPQLLTGSGEMVGATGLSVGPDGVVRLTGTGIMVPAEPSTTIVAGRVDVSSASATGGTVHIVGDRVGLFSADVNASGLTGGGTILVGGDYKGLGTLPNAQLTVVDNASVIQANAIELGDGGKVIIWSDQTTRFMGTIAAQGGLMGGNGGFVEVSGKENLSFIGFVNTAAPLGQAGTLLLDPTNITIVASTGAPPANALDGVWGAAEDVGNQTIGVDAIQTLLTSGSLILEASNSIDWQGGANLDYNGIGPGKTLELRADSSIAFNGAIVDGTVGGDSLNVVFNALGQGIFIQGNINSSGGNVTLTGNHTGAGPGVSISDNITTGIGNVSVTGTSVGGVGIIHDFSTISTTTGSVVFNGISTNSSGIEQLGNLNANGGNIQLNGNTAGNGATGLSIVANALLFSDMGGNITLTGTNTSSGTGAGVSLTNLAIQTVGGAITIVGNHAGNGVGVNAQTTDSIFSNGGNIAITGSSLGNPGVLIRPSGIVNSGGGNLQISGTTSNGDANAVFLTRPVVSGGGNITIAGNNQGTGSLGAGINIQDVNRIDSDGGTLNVTGTHRGGGQGLQINSGSTLWSGSGNQSLIGNSATGTGVLNAGELVTFDGGTIQITGVTGGISGITTTGPINSNGGDITIFGENTNPFGGLNGVFLGNTINAGIGIGDGNILVTGTGTGTARGIDSQATLFSVNGNITLNGSSINSDGVQLSNNASIQAFTPGTVQINGTTNTGDHGILIQNSTVSANAGPINLVGTNNRITGGEAGIRILGGNVTTNLGNINFTGITPNSMTLAGVNLGSGVTVSSNVGDITFTADRNDLQGANQIASTGSLTVQPLNPAIALSVGVNSMDAASNFLTIDELNRFVDGFNSIIIGRDNSTGSITVSPSTFSDNVVLRTPGSGSSGISIVGSPNLSGNFLTLNSGGTVTQTAPILDTQGLLLLGSGEVILTNPNNAIIDLAGNTTNNVSYRDVDGVDIFGIAGVNGFTTTGNLALYANGSVIQTNPIVANGLALLGNGFYVLDNPANDVNTLAIANDSTVQLFRDANALVVGTVITNGFGTITGITTSNDPVALQTGTTLDINQAINLGTGGFSLNAGGAVNQTAAIAANNLELLGTGPYNLTLPTNNVDVLAANTIGAVNYTDADGLTISTINGTTSGVTTSNSTININTINGPLTVVDTPLANDVNAGTSTVNLTAGGANQLLNLFPGANVTGASGVTLSGDNITLNGTVNAGAGIATLRQSSNGQIINLGGADTAGILGLTNAELNNVTAGVLRVGNANSGNLTVIAAIAPANTTTLSLQTDGNITQTAGGILTTPNLALQAGGNVTLTEANNVTTLAANVTGNLTYNDIDTLTVGTVDGINGITTPGNVNLTNAGTGNTITLGNLNVNGLNVSATGQINQTAGTSIVTTGLTQLTTGLANAGTVTLSNSAASGTSFGASQIGGDLNLTSTGAGTVNSSVGSLRVASTANIIANGAVLIPDGDDTIGLVQAPTGGPATNVTISRVGPIDLNNTNLPTTINGNLTVNSYAQGNVFVGTASLAQAITLDGASNSFGGPIQVNTFFNGTVNFVTSTAAITQSVPVNMTNPAALASFNAVQSAADNTPAGPITLTNVANQFGVFDFRGTNVSLQENAATVLGTGLATGNLTVQNSAGGLTDAGTVIVTGNASFTTTQANTAINLDQLAVTGTISLNTALGGDATIVNTTAVDLATSTLGGNLNATATTGNLTDSGTLTVAGNSTFTTSQANADITLNQLALTGAIGVNTNGATGDATIDTTAVNLGASNVGGALNITTTGPITNSGAAIVTGLTTLNTNGSSITLGGNNDFSTVTILNSSNVLLNDINALDLGTSTVTGTLNITTGGNLTDSGNLAVAGITTLNAGIGTITLDNANNFSTVAITTASNVTLNDINALDLGTSTVTGNLNVTTAGDLTDSGGLAIAGNTTLAVGVGNNITLNNANDFSTIAITSANNVILNDLNALDLGTSNVTGTLSVTTAGDLTDSGNLAITGNTILTAGASNNIILDGANNFSTVAVTSANNATLNDTNALNFGNVTTNGAFTVTTGGLITQTVGTQLTIVGNASFTTTLANAGNVNLANSNAGGTSLGNSDVGGNLTLTSTGVGNVNSTAGAVRVAGNALITANGTILVPDGNDQILNLNAQGGGGADVLINRVGPVVLGGTDLIPATITGSLTVNSYSQGNSFPALNNDAIILSSAGNSFGGTLSVNTAFNNTPTTVTGTASIGQAVPINMANAAANATFNAVQSSSNNTPTGPITLTNAANQLGVVSFRGTDVTINDNSALVLGNSTATGNLTLTANGTITDNGTLTVGGTTTLAAGGNDITLDSAGNDFNTVVVTSGNNVTVNDVNALQLGASSIANNLNITTGGNLTQTGAITAGGSTNLNAGVNTITANANLTSGNVSLTGGVVNLNNPITTTAGGITITNSGLLTIAANADITPTGAFLQNGAGAVSTGGDITNATSITFTGATALTGPVALSTNNGAIQFQGTIDGNSALTLNTGTGNLTFNAAVGGTQTLGDLQTNNTGTARFNSTVQANSLTTNVGGTTVLNGNVTTIAAQTYGDNVLIDSNVTLSSTNSPIAFVGTVNSQVGELNNLTVNAGTGAVTFGSQIGNQDALNDLTITTGAALSQSGSWRVNGTTSLNTNGQGITLTIAANDFGTVSVVSANNVNLVDANNLTLGTFPASLPGNLTVQATGVNVTSAITTTGSQTYTTGTLAIGANLTGSTVNVNNSGAVSGTGTIAATILNLNGSGNVGSGGNAINTQAGTIALNATSPNIVLNQTGAVLLQGNTSGNFSLTSDNTIGQGAGALTIGGNTTLVTTLTNAGTVTLSNNAAIGTSFGNSQIGGNLILNSTGAGSVNSTAGSLQVAGSATINATSPILIPDSNDVFGNGTTAVIGNDVTISRVGPVVLDNSNLPPTINGNLTVNSYAEGNTFTGNVFTASAITLNNAANSFSGTLNISTFFDGTVGTVPGTPSISQTVAVNMTNPSAAASFNVVQSATNNTPVGSITLDNATNQFGIIDFRGTDITIRENAATVLGTGTAAGNLTIQTDTNNLSNTGSISVTGNASFTTTQANATINLNQLTVNGATIVDTTGLGGNATIVTPAALNLGTSNIGGTLNVTTSGPIIDSGNVTVAGTTTVNANGNNVTLDNANNFSTVAVTSANNVTLNDTNALDLGTANVAGNLNVTTGGNLTDSGNLTVAGTTTVNANGNNVTLDNANNFSTVAVTSANNATLNDTNALDLGTTNLTGNFNVTTGGNLTDSSNVTVAGTTTVNTNGNNVTLDSAGNNFSTVAVTNTNNATLNDTNALDLGTVNIAGNLNVTTGSNLTDSGNVTVSGTTSLQAGTADITLNNANDFATVTIASANNVVLNDLNAVNFGNVTTTGGFSITAGGLITQTVGTRFSVAGDASFVSTLANAGTAVLTNAGSTVLGETTIGGDFTINSTGPISQASGTALRVAGGIVLNTPGSLTLSNTGNVLPDLTLPNGDVIITRVGTVNLATRTVLGDLTVNSQASGIQFLGILPNNAILLDQAGNSFQGSVGLITANTGTSNVTGTPGITQSGIQTVNGRTILNATPAGNITLDLANDFNQLLIDNGNNVTIQDANALILGNTNITGNFNVTTGGNLTDSGNVTVAGATTVNTNGNNVTLDNTNDFNTVAIASANNATLNDTNALDLGNTNITGNFNVTTGGNLTDSGNVTVAGATTVNTNGNNVTLDNTNDFNTVAIASANNATLNDTNALDLGNTNITGNFNVTTGGNLTDSGNLTVVGTTTVNAAGNNVTLDNTNDFNTVAIASANNATLNDTNALDLGNTNITGNFNVTTGGNLTDSGNVTVAGTTTVNAAGNNVTLDNANDFSTVAVTNANNATLNDTNALDLGTTNLTGTLNVTTGGNLTDSGNLTVAGTTTVNAAGNNVTLDNANNFSTVAVTNANNVTLNDTNALDLDTTNLIGNFTLTSQGNISQRGDLTIVGTTNISAGTGNITFTGNNNQFGLLNLTGNNATLQENSAVTLGASTLTGSLEITALTGSLTTTRTVTTGSNITLTADTLVLNAPIASPGQLTLQPLDPSRNIGIGITTGQFDLSSSTLANLTNGFSQIVIGRNDGTGTVQVAVVSFNDPVNIAGGNSLVSPNVDTRLQITGNNQGNLNSLFPNGLTFNNIESVTLGSGNDRAIFSDGATLSGILDGGLGFDTLDYTAYTSPVTINLANNTATGTGSVFNFETLIGGQGNNTLIAPNTPNLFELGAQNNGTIVPDAPAQPTITFTNFQNLTGGPANDLFLFGENSLFTGVINGGGGFDTLDYSNFRGVVAVNLDLGTATNTGGILNIERFILSASSSGEFSTIFQGKTTNPLRLTVLREQGMILCWVPDSDEDEKDSQKNLRLPTCPTDFQPVPEELVKP